MPRAFDRQQLSITHNPAQRIDMTLPRTPRIEPIDLFAGCGPLVEGVKGFGSTWLQETLVDLNTQRTAALAGNDDGLVEILNAAITDLRAKLLNPTQLTLLGAGVQGLGDAIWGLLTCGDLGAPLVNAISEAVADIGEALTPGAILAKLAEIAAAVAANPFVQGFLALIDGTGNIVVDLLAGVGEFANQLCGLVTCNPSPGGTTPATIIDGLQALIEPVLASPFVQGLVEFTEFLGRQTGNFILDVFNGLIGLADWFCGVFTCNPGNSGTTPMTIVNGVQGVIDRILEIPFIAGIVEFAQDVGVAVGNFAMDLINGTMAVVQALCSLVTTGALPTEWGAWSNTPGQIIDDLVALFTAVFDNPIVNGLRDLIEGTGNALFDTIRGAVQFFSDLAGLLSPLLAGPQAIIDFLGGILGPDGLLGWIMSIPFIGPLVSKLTGLTPASGVSLGLGQLETWARGLLTGQSTLPAGNIVGQISDAVFGVIPVSHISATSPNLLSQGNFNNDITIEAGGGCTWDGTTTATGTGGSAKFVATGSLQNLFSRQVIKVNNGDRVDITAKVKTSGFTAAAGRTMTLSIIPWKLVSNTMTAQPEVVIATRTAASTGSWATLSGATYVVANDIIRLTVRLGVTANSGAIIWFDDVYVGKSGGLTQSLVDRLLEAWGGIWSAAFGGAVTNRTVDDVHAAAAAIAGDAGDALTNLGTLQTGLIASPQTFIGSILSVVVDGITTFQGFLNTLAIAMGGSGSSNRASHVGTRAGLVTSAANDAFTNAGAAQTLAAGTNTNAYNAWYGSGGNGSAAQMTAVIQSIKSTTVDGWTVEVINTTGTWTRPAPVDRIIEFWAICVGSGGGGDKGQASLSGADGGDGGVPGRWMAKQITPSSIPSTVSCTVGAGGAGRTSRLGSAPDNGNPSAFGSLCSSTEALTASIGSIVGFYTAADSRPGVGGKGGDEAGGGKAGSAGASTPLAAGGGGGAAGGVAGSAGAAATLTGASRAGGGGGGGGGATNAPPYIGGKGGAGGRPGGGGGGGGAVWSVTPAAAGDGGDGGHGNVILLYRIKT